MNINVVNCDTPIRKNEIRVTYDGCEKMFITRYESGQDFNSKPKSQKKMKELTNPGTTKLEEFLGWIEKNCGEDCSVNVVDHLFYTII